MREREFINQQILPSYEAIQGLKRSNVTYEEVMTESFHLIHTMFSTKTTTVLFLGITTTIALGDLLLANGYLAKKPFAYYRAQRTNELLQMQHTLEQVQPGAGQYIEGMRGLGDQIAAAFFTSPPSDTDVDEMMINVRDTASLFPAGLLPAYNVEAKKTLEQIFGTNF